MGALVSLSTQKTSGVAGSTEASESKRQEVAAFIAWDWGQLPPPGKHRATEIKPATVLHIPERSQAPP